MVILAHIRKYQKLLRKRHFTCTLRNRGERCVNTSKSSRQLATRYDKTADGFLGFIDIACIRLGRRRLAA